MGSKLTADASPDLYRPYPKNSLSSSQTIDRVVCDSQSLVEKSLQYDGLNPNRQSED
jgi:hypothetical protein